MPIFSARRNRRSAMLNFQLGHGSEPPSPSVRSAWTNLNAHAPAQVGMIGHDVQVEFSNGVQASQALLIGFSATFSGSKMVPTLSCGFITVSQHLWRSP